MEQRPKKYKVRDMTTDLYWTGKIRPFTGEPVFNARGRAWNHLDSLVDSFSAMKKININISPFWEIVEYTTSVANGERYPAVVLIDRKVKR